MLVRPAEQPVSGLRAAVAASVAGKAVEVVTLVLLATVVPRLLGPADYGRFAVPLTVVTLGSLALTLGGPTLMARYVPAAPPAERLALARSLGWRLARGRGAQLAVLTAVALVVAVAAPDRVASLDLAVVVVALWLNVAATLLLQTGLGLGRTWPWSTRYPLQNAVLIAAVVVLHPVAGARGAVVAVAVAALAGAGFALAAMWRTVGTRAADVPIPDGAIRFGSLQAGGAALTQLAQRGGVLSVALLAGSTVETGYAALAIGIALGVTYAVLQAFTVALPHLAAAERGDADTGEAVLRRLAGGLLALILPAGLVVAALLDDLVPRLFGSEYAAAVDAFGPAVALVVLAPVASLAVQVAALRLRPEAALASGGAAAAGFVLASVVGVPAWGAAGGTSAALVGVACGTVTAVALLPGAAGPRLLAASFGGAAGVLAVAQLL